MKIGASIPQEEVWERWFSIEKRRWPREVFRQFRHGITGELPESICWYEAEIEGVDNLFIISSDDWMDITQSTFLVKEAAANLDKPFADDRIQRGIRKNIPLLESQHLTLVSNTANGPFTVIDGNKRAVALAYLGKLVGTAVCVGIDRYVASFWWARYTYLPTPDCLFT